MNNKYKLVILSRSFAMASEKPLQYLNDHKEIGYRLVRNTDPANTAYIAEEIGDADAVIVGSDVIDRYVLDRCPNLKVISKHGVGLDNIDLERAKQKGIKVTIAANANNESVADLALMFMLNIMRDFEAHLIRGSSPDWKAKQLTNDLFEKTVGIIGFGQIGMSVAKRLKGFSCRLLICDPMISQNDVPEDIGGTVVPLERLLRESDIVTLHAPLTKDTYHLIDDAAISRMKDLAVIINTSRGDLVDEKALYDALRSGKLKGAGLDVFSREPPVDEPLLTLKNVVATPHVASHTVEANCRLGIRAAENVIENLKDQIPEIRTVSR